MIRRLHSGFTLIEVLVALAVFGVLTALAYMTLGQSLNNAELLNERMDRLQSVQRTMTYLGTDLMQAVPRPIRAEMGDPQPALLSSFAAEFALQLTHGGWPNSAGVPRSSLQRTAYRIEDDDLVRYHWAVLDRTANSFPVATVLLEGIESLTFRFLQDDGEWINEWPPLAMQAGPDSFLLPRAVEFTLVLPEEGELVRIVEVSP